METYVDAYGEKKYVLTLPVDVLRRLADAITNHYPNMAETLREAIVRAGDGATATVDLFVTEAATVSYYLDQLK